MLYVAFGTVHDFSDVFFGKFLYGRFNDIIEKLCPSIFLLLILQKIYDAPVINKMNFMYESRRIQESEGLVIVHELPRFSVH